MDGCSGLVKADTIMQPVQLSVVAEGEGVGRSHSVFLPFRFVACLPR